MSDEEIVECPNCAAEYEADSYCGDCGYDQDVGELVKADAAPKPEPVYARATQARSLPVHEAAWCPYCVVWLGTFPSKDAARAYERSLEHHPFEFCTRRQASLNGSEEWRLRHEAGKRGSLAMAKPGGPRVPPKGAIA
ncbi:MAG: hypothetical protein WDA16_08090 [Candidatus Thermoplasmatota archaeon]